MAKTIGMWALWKNSTDAFDKAFLTIGKKYETIWLLQVCCCVRSNDCVKLLIEPKDRKSTRLNSSHSQISYAVFCLKKKKQDHRTELCGPFVTLVARPLGFFNTGTCQMNNLTPLHKGMSCLATVVGKHGL